MLDPAGPWAAGCNAAAPMAAQLSSGLKFAADGVRVLLVAMAMTWRWRIAGRRYLDLARQSGRPVALVSFHGRLLPSSYAFTRPGIKPLCVLISPSTDGEMIRRVVEGLGMRTASGSSGREGARGFIQLLRSVRSMPGIPVGFLVDGGGKGPRGRCKPGAAALARRSGAVILPAVASARPAWLAGSWDRFLVPKPFAQVELRFGRPFLADSDEELTRQRIERDLVALTRAADRSTGLVDSEPLQAPVRD